MADGGPPAPPAPYVPQTPPGHPIYTANSTSCTTYSHKANSTSSYSTIKLVTYKPEFACQPDEDEEGHLLRMNDCIDTHAFPEGVTVQHFCLTLVGEARLWYESLRSINVDWNRLQNQFRHAVLLR